jgi:hypothetical protein
VNNETIKVPLTMAEFTRDVMRPAMLRAIERGQLDDALGEMLADHASGEMMFDDETLRAILARAYIVCTSLGPWEKFFTSVGSVKIGAQLRIKVPAEEF